MQDFLSFIALGIVQGLTEFLPVSSTGHLILVRELFGVSPERGLAIDAVLQLATALAVILYFARDYLRLLKVALFKSMGRMVEKSDWALVLALIVGTVPAVIIGLLLEDTMATVFRSAELVAYTLVGGSVVMLLSELLLSKRKEHVHEISVKTGLVVGMFQALALIPGMSRSGMTISGGIFMGLTREGAARFGFLLSVPIILGSGLKKLIELYGEGALAVIGPELLLGFLAAFISGLAAIHFLLMFVRTQPLYIFIAYRVLLAAFILALL